MPIDPPSGVRRHYPAEMVRAALAPRQDEIAGVAAELVRAGWAEAGAGNISVRLEAQYPGHETMAAGLKGTESLVLPFPAPALAGRVLLVSVAGSRMRTVARDPDHQFGLLGISSDGVTGTWLGSGSPTSELAVHLACHDALTCQGRPQRCLLHTHPTALTALTRLLEQPADLDALLSPAGAEHALLRDRLAVTLPLSAGSLELARASAALIGLKPALVWPGHGMLAAGDTLDVALDLIQLADKAATIVLAGPTSVPGPRTRGSPMRPGRSLQGRPAPEGIETRYEVRTRDSALNPAEFARLPRRPVTVVLDNIRSAFNVGSIFRLADACRCTRVVTCGYTAHPPHHKLEQAALGTTKSVPWYAVVDTLIALRELREQGLRLVAVETVASAVPYHRFEYAPPVALVFGNEALGLPGPVLEACDAVVDIPVAGFKNSINVAVAAGIVLYDLCRRQDWLDSEHAGD